MYHRDLAGLSPQWEDSLDGSMQDYPIAPRESYPIHREHAIDDWANGQRSLLFQQRRFWPSPDFSIGKKDFIDAFAPNKDTETGCGNMYGCVYGDRPSSRGNSGGRSPLRASHDLLLTFPDSDSGFSSSLRTRSGALGRSSLAEDVFSSPPKGRLMRSRSLSRLNDSYEADSAPCSPRPQDGGYRRPDLTGSDRLIKELKEKLEESENRRTVLMSKLKEAQNTLQAQGDRLDRIENTAKENEYVVEGLKIKEQEYRQKIGSLEREQDEKDFLRLENLRLREDMQTRISSLGHQLKSLQSQHCTTEAESSKRNSLLEQTSKALNLLEEENAKFQKERDTAVVEMKTARDQCQVTKTKFALVEEDNTQMKTALKKITEEYQMLQRSQSQTVGKVQELETLVQTLRNENERLTSAWELTTQEKQKLAGQQDKAEERLAELRSQVTAAHQEKEKSLQEKIELQKQQQQLIVDKEHLMKSKISLEEQLNDQQGEVTQARMVQSRNDEERRRLEEELKAVKKVSEDLSTELAGVKSSFERALEQVNLLENGKRIANQQQHLLEQEVHRVEQELQKTKDNLQSKQADFKMERSHLEENTQKLKDELRGVKVAKGQAEDKCRELETKLKRANEELQQSVSVQQSELDSWKNTCERLTGSVSRKEAELQSLSDKCGDLEDLVSRLKRECKVYEEQLEQCLEAEDMGDRLREDNRRLLQEKAENEQMIQLLEMQKEVLTKSSESNLDRLHEVDQLMSRMDQLRNDNTLLRDRIVELEKLRDNLMKQKDDSLLSPSSVFGHTDSSEGRTELKLLLDQNDQLQHVSQVLSKKMEKLEQENSALRLRANISMETIPKEEFDRLERDKKLVENEHSLLQRQHKELSDRHQRFVINYGHNGADNKTNTDLQSVLKEKAALEKQVAYLQGQMILYESSKKRAEEAARELRVEVEKLEQHGTDQHRHSSTGKVADLEKSLKESGKKRESLEALVRSLKQQLMQEKKKLPTDDIDGDLSQLRGELEQLTAVLSGKDEQIDQLDGQLEDLRRELQKERQKPKIHEPSNKSGKKQEVNQSSNSTTIQDGKPAVDSKPNANKSKVLSQPLPLLGKCAATPTKLDNAGGVFQKVERPGVVKKVVKSKSGELASPEAQPTGQIFKPPSRNVHPRLQTLMERYKGNDSEDEPGVKDSSDSSPDHSGDRSNLPTDPSDDWSNTIPSPGGWPYSKLPSANKTDKNGRVCDKVNTAKVIHLPVKSSQEPELSRTEKSTNGFGAKNGVESVRSNGNGTKDGSEKATLMDSQEQRDISSLIQKRASIPKPILSIRPPKITSKVVAALLSRGSLPASAPSHKPTLSATL